MSRLAKVKSASTFCSIFEKRKYHCDGCKWLKGRECYLSDQMCLSTQQVSDLTHELGDFLNVPTR